MAQEVAIPGTDSNAKICNVVGVAALSLIPFYHWIWWYRVNRELADYGRARGTEELGTSPGKSLLAVSLGALIIVPAVMSFFSTHKRITTAQAMTGQTPINGWLSVVLYFVFAPAWIAYMQSGTNAVWENTGSSAAPVAPAITEAAPAAEVAETTAAEVAETTTAEVAETTTEPSEDQPSA